MFVLLHTALPCILSYLVVYELHWDAGCWSQSQDSKRVQWAKNKHYVLVSYYMTNIINNKTRLHKIKDIYSKI